MGENHEIHELTNKFTEKKRNLMNALTLLGVIEILFALIIYATPDEFLSYDKKLTAIITGLGFITAAMITLMGNYYKYQQLQKDSLTKIFDLLSREDVRKARRNVHEEYCKLHKAGLKIIFKNSDTNDHLEDEVDLVLSSLDQVSVLVLNDLIDRELFFNTYGEMIVRDWKTLETEIETRQNHNDKTLQHFTRLKNDFEARKDIGNTEPYCKD